MFKPVSSRVDFPKMEQDILAFWKEQEVFRKSVESRQGKPVFSFYEGPPTANGNPGIHHVLARVFKDMIPRFKTMQGFQVPRKGGWDTHGLPVELEVEKELGFTGKQEIEAYGIAEFNAKCRQSVFRYVKEWETMTDRIGFWVDMENAYVTFHNSYIESCWWIINQLWNQGLVYQGYKVTPHCPRCGTSLSSHEVALGYKDAEDPSVYVRFKLDTEEADARARFKAKGAELDTPVHFLVWTTTPWTLPGNAALAVSPDSEYVLVESEPAQGEAQGTERLILAEALLGQALKTPHKVLARFNGAELAGLRYEPLYKFLDLDKPAHRVITGDFVSMEDGTGIVHIAPAFGEIDLEIGRSEGLPVIMTVDLKGKIIPEVTSFAGLFVKDADPLIIKDLVSRGLMYRSEKVLHTYPFCWRCDTPLLYYAKTSWYIRTTEKKDRLLVGNEKINWYPEHLKQGRFGDWLENNVDWAISRERYWGTPLNIWQCQKCNAYECIESVSQLEKRSSRSGLSETLDLHRPYVDEIEFACEKCGGTMVRIPEVLDCWFDSGAMPVAQWHYPFENQDVFKQRFPANFICEAIDQTRGWFYSLHAISTMLFDEPTYANVLCLGHILDAKGEKMSKSRGNVVDPWSVLNTQGADALRWYLYTATPPGNPRRFSAELVGEALRKFLLTLWNTYSFFVIYANIDGWKPSSEGTRGVELSTLDLWVLSRLSQTVIGVTECLERYDPTTAARSIQEFVDELSNWYVRRSRRRFWKSENDTDKLAAYETLYECLVTLSKLLAPFTPFVAEELYQNLVRSVDANAPLSVHLADYPVADRSQIDTGLIEDTELVMKVVSLGRGARAKANLKVRQPLSQVVVKPRSAGESQGLEKLAPQILDELNTRELTIAGDESEMVTYLVKPNLAILGPKYGKEVGRIAGALRTMDAREIAIAVKKGLEVTVEGHNLLPNEILVETMDKEGVVVAEEGGYMVGLSTRLTPDLIDEGIARELVHRLQTMRKSAGFDIADNIITYYQATAHLDKVIEGYGDYIKQETLSRILEKDGIPADAYQEKQKVEGEEILLAVKKID